MTASTADVRKQGDAESAPRRKRRRPAWVRHVGYTLGTLIVFFGGWWAITVIFDVSPLVLPDPRDVFAEMWRSRSVLWSDAQTTIVEAVLGFALATAVGVPLGVLIVFSRRARDSLYPMLVASQMVPKVAIAPIFIVWFGLGLSSKVAVAMLIAVFAIVISTAVGMQAVDQDMVRLFRSMGSNELRTFLRLRLPVATPSIFAGLKLGMAHATVGAVVGEFIAANSGLGYYILFENGQLNTEAVYAGILVMAVVGVVLYFSLEVAEAIFSPYKRRRVRRGSNDSFRQQQSGASM